MMMFIGFEHMEF